MRADIAKAIEHNLPTFGECGGFLYLHKQLIDKEGRAFKMVGAIKEDCRCTTKLQRFGYVNLTASKDTMLCKKGEKIPAHEFHYCDSDNKGDSFLAVKPLRNINWETTICEGNLFAGFPHLYFYSNTEFAKNFVKSAVNFQEQRVK